jgi:soluble lytic murein transglycosylase-like protein
LAALVPGTAFAQDPLAPIAPPAQAPAETAPVVLAPPVAQPQPQRSVVAPKDWAGVFRAIRSGNWAAAEAGIAALPAHVLTPVAKAELFTARGSPTVGLARLQALLAEAPDLPQAEQLARMAMTRGATQAPLIVPRKPLVMLGSAPRRVRAQSVQGDAWADQLRAQVEPLLEADDAAGAELLLMQTGANLSYEGRAEIAQRIAWTYYRLGRDGDARRVADGWRPGARGDWAAHAAWISGLAAWRMNDCEAASRAFREVAGTSRERELGAAAYYWAARAEQACRRPRSVAPLLKAAARNPESFYGLLARETLGTDTRLPPDPHSFAAAVEGLANVRRAVELVNIGERALGEEMLRHQARIGNPAEHHGLIEFAKRLDLAGAQFWLAHNGQRGAVADAQDRYPAPRWSPVTGWRIDPALAFAHIIQESTFKTEAVSPVGAVGLMQVRPGTAEDMARARGLAYSRGQLTDPRMNLEFGQSFIERVRGMPGTAGQLPRVIAAYNAGPTPVARWAGIPGQGDPLLWIESIPYWETRYYVPAVLRNMWVYQGLSGGPLPTLKALAQHRWPAFPTTRTLADASAAATDPSRR